MRFKKLIFIQIHFLNFRSSPLSKKINVRLLEFKNGIDIKFMDDPRCDALNFLLLPRNSPAPLSRDNHKGAYDGKQAN